MIAEPIHEPTLTPREVEILEMVASGYSAKEAASILKIAPRTVERHTENLRLKMRARNRAHMIALAVSTGVLTLVPEPSSARPCSSAAAVSPGKLMM